MAPYYKGACNSQYRYAKLFPVKIPRTVYWKWREVYIRLCRILTSRFSPFSPRESRSAPKQQRKWREAGTQSSLTHTLHHHLPFFFKKNDYVSIVPIGNIDARWANLRLQILPIYGLDLYEKHRSTHYIINQQRMTILSSVNVLYFRVAFLLRYRFSVTRM